MSSRAEVFARELKDGRVYLLDGAMGTELQRRGVPTTLPLWSASALIDEVEVVTAIHKAYIDAGAEIVTTNTFRTNPRAFERAGVSESWRELALRACRAAAEARDACGKDVLIAGSIAPVEDCYRPDLVPSEEELRDEHGRLAAALAEGGVDFILIETMNCVRETVAAAEAASETGLPFAVSFVCSREGELLSGEPVGDALALIARWRPLFAAVNCRPPEEITEALGMLLNETSLPCGAYANGWGHPQDGEGWEFDSGTTVEHYADFVNKWRQMGARVIGGCCGTTPEYIQAVRKSL